MGGLGALQARQAPRAGRGGRASRGDGPLPFATGRKAPNGGGGVYGVYEGRGTESIGIAVPLDDKILKKKLRNVNFTLYPFQPPPP